MTEYSPLASPRATLQALEYWGLHNKKSLGQHWLVDDGVIGRILRLADRLETPASTADISALGVAKQRRDWPVLEIGPGLGTLTEALLRQSNVVQAVEIDQRLQPVLEDIRQRYPKAFSYQLADALQLEPSSLPEHFDLVANLPYQLAATLILRAFAEWPGLCSATVMVQSEVAERLLSTPGSKNYGAVTVKLALLASDAGNFKVSRRSFLPPPRVDSTVLRLERLSGPQAFPRAEWPRARQFIDAAFAERRKTLKNSLLSAWLLPAEAGMAGSKVPVEWLDELLSAADIDGSRRAETLSVAEFCRLLAVWR